MLNALRVIPVESCIHCPYRVRTACFTPFSYECKKFGKHLDITRPGKIPEWCELKTPEDIVELASTPRSEVDKIRELRHACIISTNDAIEFRERHGRDENRAQFLAMINFTLDETDGLKPEHESNPSWRREHTKSMGYNDVG